MKNKTKEWKEEVIFKRKIEWLPHRQVYDAILELYIPTNIDTEEILSIFLNSKIKIFGEDLNPKWGDFNGIHRVSYDNYLDEDLSEVLDWFDERENTIIGTLKKVKEKNIDGISNNRVIENTVQI